MSDNTVLDIHWADHAASALLKRYGREHTYVCASGVSPSGRVHIGNFREVLTAALVVRALEERGCNVLFFHFWDDYDALRKIPSHLPSHISWESFLRMPLSRVPDPCGQCQSYAEHFEKLFEKELDRVGICPTFLYQAERYEKGDYNAAIGVALHAQDTIREILNESRTTPLPLEWTCVTAYCRTCHKDEVTILREGEFLTLTCVLCQTTWSCSINDASGLKLLWRVDWPMRWAEMKVDFEPGGKDHSAQGGTFETGQKIVRAVWHRDPPAYVQYDFVLAKGIGTKLSSSKGELISLEQALEVYEPDVLRWIFASRRPNMDFSIAFDLDVLKAYDDFDRCERIAFESEEADAKKVGYEKRIYELACVEKNALERPRPWRAPFRHLCNILQIFEGDLSRTKSYFQSLQTMSDPEIEALAQRCQRAWKWITTYAPQSFRFSLRPIHMRPTLSHPQLLAKEMEELGKRKTPPSEKELETLYQMLAHEFGVSPKVVFENNYAALIHQKHGPRLSTFMLAIGLPRCIEHLKNALTYYQ